MKMKRRNREGAALLVVVISMIAAGLIGAALLSMATSARYERVTFGITNRAYYLAESGAAYVRARMMSDTNYPPRDYRHAPITNTMANGDQFIVTAMRTNIYLVTTNGGVTNVSMSMHTFATSVGIADPGTALEARQQIFFDIVSRGISSEDLDDLEESLVLFEGDAGKPDYNDEMWNEDGFSKVEVKDTGPSQGIALVPKVDKGNMEGRLALNWQDKPGLSSAMMSIYEAKDNLLGYDMQVKLAYFPNVPSTHLMLGLSFRLHENTEKCYGLSFFRSDATTSDKNLAKDAPWVLNLDANLAALRGTNFHLILWFRANADAPIELINSRPMPSNFMYLNKGAYEMKYYNTMLVKLREEYTDSNKTGRVNKISAYLATTNTYPVWPNYYSTNAIWQENTTVFPPGSAPVLWSGVPIPPATGNTVTNNDSRITSEGFATNQNAEFGVHLFYDRNSNNENFFRDLSIRFDVEGIPYSGTQIQW
jgi:hypothetical protein